MTNFRCRFCAAALSDIFVDLGMSPLSNSFLKRENLNAMEPFYPLTVFVCRECFLVQLPEFEAPDNIFSDYVYFSSYSDLWLAHVRRYCDAMRSRLSLGARSQVVEIASNDGYLLQYFREAGIPVLGIEPAANVAKVAEERGIPTVTEFFGSRLATRLVSEGKRADLLLGNNVLAHVPDINDFVAGMKILLAPEGTITMEFPHLLRLIEGVQFDTIYHEHFSYLSLHAAKQVFAAHDLALIDVEELPTHGGSLRIYAAHADGSVRASRRVGEVERREVEAGLLSIDAYSSFARRAAKTKRDLLRFLIDAREAEETVAAYGAAAKGNTLLNFCGIRADLIEYVVDRSPHKQGLFLPGTHLPVYSPDRVRETRPDYLLILPWNLRDEIVGQMSHIRGWGGRFITAIPGVEVVA